MSAPTQRLQRTLAALASASAAPLLTRRQETQNPGRCSAPPPAATWPGNSIPAHTCSLRHRTNADGGSGGAGSVGTPLTIQFTITNWVPRTNLLPVVALTNPPPGSSFYAPATIRLDATASDPDGSITNVEFFTGDTKLGEDDTAPYSFEWLTTSGGAAALIVRATDNEGGVSQSSQVNVTVLNTNFEATVSGELKKWHRVTVTWTGPMASETGNPNPFRNYRLNVTFTHGKSRRSLTSCPVSSRQMATRRTPAQPAATSGG